jgi:hypothetical protein
MHRRAAAASPTSNGVPCWPPPPQLVGDRKLHRMDSVKHRLVLQARDPPYVLSCSALAADRRGKPPDCWSRSFQVAGLAVVVWRRVCALLSGRARLAPSHPSIASRATTARLFRPRSLPPGRTNLIVRFPAARHARRHGHEGLKWVESGGSVAVMQTAAIGALPPMAAEGRVGSDPAGVRPNRDSPQLPQMRH